MLQRIWKPTLRTSAVLVAAAGAAFAGADGEHERTMRVLFSGDDGSHHEVVLEDLDELAQGESRELTSEDGEPVTITREGDSYRIDAAGRSIHVLGDDERLDREIEHKVRRRVEIRSEDGPKVWISGNEAEGSDVTVFHGAGGAHGFTFSTGDEVAELDELPPMPLLLSVDGLLERLDANEKFAGLDDLTRELVREAIRESAPKHGPFAWHGKDGDDALVRVIVRDRESEESTEN